MSWNLKHKHSIVSPSLALQIYAVTSPLSFHLHIVWRYVETAFFFNVTLSSSSDPHKLVPSPVFSALFSIISFGTVFKACAHPMQGKKSINNVVIFNMLFPNSAVL